MSADPTARGLGLAVPERERAVARVCFSEEPPEADLRALGSPERWRIYRSLVRDRLRAMLRAGLPRTVETLGERRFEQWFSRWLAESPPRTHYIRDVVPELAAFAAPRWREGQQPELDPWAADLIEYEAALWEVKYMEDPEPATVDFDFDAVPVLEPALKLLRLQYPVHEKRKEGERYPEDPVRVVLYRQRKGHRAKTWVLNDMAADLVERWLSGDRTVTETVKEVTSERGVTIDQAFLEKLSAMLADFLERGILRGSRG